MATQASAITFLSIPGQGFESGIGFVQNYFGLPLALIVVCAVFLPMYRRLNVYTAYEFLGQRFDKKTRLLGAGLFLLQRGLAAGVTIYAPAIIISTVLGWPLDLVIVFTGLLVIVYTVTGGSEAVALTHTWQMAVIATGMLTAMVVLLLRLPDGLGFTGAAHVAGALGKLQAVDFSLDPSRRYTVWTGVFGGLFLSLSYFGTDQSQVQRYIGGASLREGRLGLMFNAVLKIPMQFVILLLGAFRRRRRAEPVRDPRVAPGPHVGRRRAGSERAGRHGRGEPAHPRDPRRGQGRPRGRRPTRQDEGLRLRLHHVHPHAAAARRG